MSKHKIKIEYRHDDGEIEETNTVSYPNAKQVERDYDGIPEDPSSNYTATLISGDVEKVKSISQWEAALFGGMKRD